MLNLFSKLFQHVGTFWEWFCTIVSFVNEASQTTGQNIAGFLTTPSAPTIITRVITVLLGILAAWAIRRIYHKMFTEFDRSALVRIEIPNDGSAESFANCAILNGPVPFTTYNGVTVPNVQTRDVVAFIVGKPCCVSNPAKLGLEGWEPGHFAYAIVHWEHYQEIRQLILRGYCLQQAFLPDESGKPSLRPETRFLRFATASEGQQGVADVMEGFRASFRFQPYKKHGFRSTDLDYRRLSLQLQLFFWLVKLLTPLNRVYNWVSGLTQKLVKLARKAKEGNGA